MISDADLKFFHEIGYERGRGLFPASDLRAGFKISYLAGLREIYSIADDTRYTGMVEFATHGAREHPRLMEVTELAHGAALGRLGDRTRALEILLRHLLDGSPASDAAEAANVSLPGSYLLLLCRRQRTTGPAARFQPASQVLDGTPGVLWRADNITGNLLILVPADDLATSRVTAAALTGGLSERLSEPLHIAEVHAATLDAVPTAYREAQQMMPLVAAMPDARSRPYAVDELLVELAVARQPALRHRLADLLIPLREGTDLQITLNALFECELDRERTSRKLHIHRRTLTYRIQRIRELTGLDPATAHGIQVLRTAVTASRLPTIHAIADS